MAESILDWLDAEEGAQDIYSLLGHSRFDPDQKGIKASISKATRELLPYQSHNNNNVAQRAMRLLTELGGAEIVVGDDEKLREHHKQIVDMLYDDYAAINGDDVEKWNRDDVRNWLRKEAAVHKASVDSTLEMLCPAPVEDEEDLVDIEELEEEAQAERIAKKKRELAKRKKAIEKRKQAAEQRKIAEAERKKKKQADRLEDMLESLGVRPQNADWRLRATKKSRAERRSGGKKGKGKSTPRGRATRGRRHQQSSPKKLPLIIGGSLLVVGVVALWLIFGGGQPDPAVVKITLSPADATVTVYHVVDPDDTTKNRALGEEDGVTIKVVEDVHTVSFVGAKEEETYKVMCTHEKHIENGFTWTPRPRSLLEQPIKLPPKKGGE